MKRICALTKYGLQKRREAHNYCRNELKALSMKCWTASARTKNEFDRMLVKMIENLSKRSNNLTILISEPERTSV